MSIIIRRVRNGSNEYRNRQFTLGSDYRVINNRPSDYIIEDDNGKESIIHKSSVGNGSFWEHSNHDTPVPDVPNVHPKPPVQTKLTPENQMKTQTTITATTFINNTDVRDLTAANILGTIRSEKASLEELRKTTEGLDITSENLASLVSGYQDNIKALTVLLNDKLTEEA